MLNFSLKSYDLFHSDSVLSTNTDVSFFFYFQIMLLYEQTILNAFHDRFWNKAAYPGQK